MNRNRWKSPASFKSPSCIKLQSALLDKKKIALTLIRLDEIHPAISGNKWFKLKENIRSAIQAGKRQLLSFGGAHSNHLAALAAAAAHFELDSIGLVRGWHGKVQLTSTLENCRKAGMQLHFLSREDYAQKESMDFVNQLKARYPEAWIIPEGGNNRQGRTGASEIAAYIPSDSHHIILPAGTGTTLAGIRQALPARQQVLGMVPFKQKEDLEKQIAKMLDQDLTTRLLPTQPHPVRFSKAPDAGIALNQHSREASYTVRDPASTFGFRLCNDYHFGGFAKSKPELIDFMNEFYQTHGIPSDFIYTGKMLYGLMDLIEKDHFPPGSRLCTLHTGGLQGNLGRKDLVY